MKFQPNITTTGRVVRGAIAIALAAGAILANEVHWAVRGSLILAAAFVAFEALRGWCALRACGIKTRL